MKKREVVEIVVKVLEAVTKILSSIKFK